MKVRSYISPDVSRGPVEETVLRTNPLTAGELKPEPKENYTVTYERIVLEDSFELSKLKPDVTLDIWLTRPSFPKANVAANAETIPITGEFSIRELSENVNTYTTLDEFKAPPTPPTFATVARMGLEAIGPQEKLMYAEDHDWTPKIFQHTNFSIVQKELKITTSPPYVGSIVTVPLNPRECGDLLSNMYFTCTLPPNVNYTRRVGRAMFNKIELCFNEFVIQRYDDNWATIHDELFQSAEESLVLDQILDGQKLIVPFKFFFCEKDNYLPLCALYNHNVYIKLYFNEQSWFTDYPGDLEITDPALVFDQVFLTTEERNFYKLTTQEIVIPVVEQELPQLFNKGNVTINMSANFNVSMLVWFIRNKSYETSSDYTTRYSYGYVSELVRSYTSFTNWNNETVYYVPVIDYIDIFINNRNIVRGLSGDLYYTYHQPIEHGLSVPDKTLYCYCFSNEPKNRTMRGDLDFRTLPSKTTNLKIKFKDSLVPQLNLNYNLYLYYYGYKTLSIDKGFGVLRA